MCGCVAVYGGSALIKFSGGDRKRMEFFMFSKRKENEMLKKALTKAMNDIDELKDIIYTNTLMINNYTSDNDKLYDQLKAEKRKTKDLTEKLNDSKLYRKYCENLKQYNNLLVKYNNAINDFVEFMLHKY